MPTRYWLMKAEPDSRIVKGYDVKVSFFTPPYFCPVSPSPKWKQRGISPGLCFHPLLICLCVLLCINYAHTRFLALYMGENNHSLAWMISNGWRQPHGKACGITRRRSLCSRCQWVTRSVGNLFIYFIGWSDRGDNWWTNTKSTGVVLSFKLQGTRFESFFSVCVQNISSSVPVL